MRFAFSDYVADEFETSFEVQLPEVQVEERVLLDEVGGGYVQVAGQLPLAVVLEEQLDEIRRKVEQMLERYDGVDVTKFGSSHATHDGLT